jgi:hypothetical protein
MAADLHVPLQYSTIQAAIDAASDGDTVVVGPGSYAPINLGAKRVSVRSSGGRSVTIIDGAGQGLSAVTLGAGSTLESRIAGFTIRAGMGTGAWYYANGGGIHCPAGSVTVEDCDVVGSTSGTGYGGGLRMTGPALVLRRCRFLDNWSWHDGGGINVSIEATDSSEVVPGSVAVRVVIEDCEFRNCYSYNAGGLAMSFRDQSDLDDQVIVRRCIFTGNSGEYGPSSLFPSDARFSGIAGSRASHQLSVDRCVFDSQTLSLTAGAYFEGGHPLNVRLTDCLVTRGAVRRVVGVMEVGKSWLCQGVSVAGGFVDLGANTAACATPEDCNLNGVPDAFECVTGAAIDADRDLRIDACACNQADLNGNGSVDGADLGMLLFHWGPVVPGSADSDLNGDGVVTGADLGLLLAFWGSCSP